MKSLVFVLHEVLCIAFQTKNKKVALVGLVSHIIREKKVFAVLIGHIVVWPPVSEASVSLGVDGGQSVPVIG